MVKRCSHGLCNSDDRYLERLEGGKVKFVPFPKPKTQYDKCLRWIKLCGRSHGQLSPSKINKNKYVCTKALNDFHAERIGHGYRSLECKDLYARLLKQRTHLECCPISSIYTGGAPGGKVNHPIQRFAKDSVNFSLSTDDPICFNSTLSDDFVLARELGLTDEQITQSIFNAARSAFCSEAEKKELLKELVKVYGQRRPLTHSGNGSDIWEQSFFACDLSW